MNLKQTLFVGYYTEGETKGNCEQSMLKAGYKPGYARKNAGKYIQAITGIKEAIDEAVEEIKEWMEGGNRLCDRLFNERYVACVAKNDNTNAIRCIENKAKNVGYYAADNEQKAEKTVLDTEQQALYEDYLAYRRRMLLMEADGFKETG